MPNNDFKYFQDMFRDLRTSPYVRVAVDEVPEQSIFVYNYLRESLLPFAQRDVSISMVKRVLRDSLRGIAALHERGIVHTDIKANNIMLDWEEKDGITSIQRVQITDIDDSAIVGRQVGNWMWRSPEAHASARVHKPSDIFSFGLVVCKFQSFSMNLTSNCPQQCIYTLMKRVVLAVAEEELKEGEDKLAIVLERQLSYFSDLESLEGMLEYLGDSPWTQIFIVIAEGFNKDFPREPFKLWEGFDPVLKNLVGRMTNMDPRRRITAKEALTHEWFADVVGK